MRAEQGVSRLLDVSGFCGRSEERVSKEPPLIAGSSSASGGAIGNRRGTRPRGVDVDAESLARGSSDLRQRAAP